MLRRLALTGLAAAGFAAAAPAQSAPPVGPAIGPAVTVLPPLLSRTPVPPPGTPIEPGYPVGVRPTGVVFAGLREVVVADVRILRVPDPVRMVPVRWKLGVDGRVFPDGLHLTAVAPGSGLWRLRPAPGGRPAPPPAAPFAEPGDVLVAVNGARPVSLGALLHAVNTAPDPRDVEVVFRNVRDGRAYLAYVSATPAR